MFWLLSSLTKGCCVNTAETVDENVGYDCAVGKVMGIFYDLSFCLWCLFMGY